MIHRHLDYALETPLGERGDAALDDLLDRGDMADWRPIAQAIAQDPFGPLAARIVHLCRVNPRYGTSALWLGWIAQRRETASQAGPAPTLSLAEVRRSQGLSQRDLATRMGMSQSDLSKTERRPDWKVSTLADFAAALDLSLSISVVDAEGRQVATLDVGSRPLRRTTGA